MTKTTHQLARAKKDAFSVVMRFAVYAALTSHILFGGENPWHATLVHTYILSMLPQTPKIWHCSSDARVSQVG